MNLLDWRTRERESWKIQAQLANEGRIKAEARATIFSDQVTDWLVEQGYNSMDVAETIAGFWDAAGGAT